LAWHLIVLKFNYPPASLFLAFDKAGFFLASWKNFANRQAMRIKELSLGLARAIFVCIVLILDANAGAQSLTVLHDFSAPSASSPHTNSDGCNSYAGLILQNGVVRYNGFWRDWRERCCICCQCQRDWISGQTHLNFELCQEKAGQNGVMGR
jgi:hypothetical protein